METVMQILGELMPAIVALLVAAVGYLMTRLETVVKNTKTQIDDNALEALAEWGVEYKTRNAAINTAAGIKRGAKVDKKV